MSTTDLPGEIWKTIPFATDYMASNMGRIKVLPRQHLNCNGVVSNRPEKILSQSSPEGRYLQVAINRTLYRVHRVILTTFVGYPPTDNHQGNHLDGNGFNNRLDNLEWTTPSENVHHAINVLGHVGGTGPIKPTLDYKLKCFEIYVKFSQWRSVKSLGEEYGLHDSTISNMLSYTRDLIDNGDIPNEYRGIEISEISREDQMLKDALHLYDYFCESKLSGREFCSRTGIPRGRLRRAIDTIKRYNLL